MKFQHHFTLAEAHETYRIYHADHSTIRLDFMEHMLRVAILRDDTSLTPTYTVRPRLPEDPACGEGLPFFSPQGRDKLSTEGLPLIAPAVVESEDRLTFSIDDVDVSVDLLNFQMTLTKQGRLLYHDRDYIAYNFDHELGDGSVHFLTREEDERIFGLGDKTGPVNKNKMHFCIAASDAMGFDARSSDPLYKQLPFYICENSCGSYGIYYDTYSNGEMDFGKEINNYYAPFKSFRCEEENLVFYILLGSVPEIVTMFSRLCGPLLFPPRWTYAYAGSTMSYTDAPDADTKLRHFLELCEQYGLHPGGFYLSSGYTQIGEKRYVFHWNQDKIPSPEDLASHFSEHGVEFFPNVKPAFLTSHPLYEKIADKGWFLHYEDGTPAIFPFWDDYGSYLDFTHPETYAFWTDCVKEQLVDKGYHNIWNDNNEYDVVDREVYAHGWEEPIRAHLIRPLFSFLMTMASLAAQDQSKRTVSVSRCGIGGLGRIATTWTGDNHTGFDDFRYNHRMAMTMSLSGFFNFGQDIGGFAGPRPEEELFLRWIQYGIFTPRFVLHSWNPDNTSTMPWLYPEQMPAVQTLFALRNALVPYLYNETYRSACRHEPIIYPVFLKHNDYDTESDVFFFGDSILAAPVFDPGADSVCVDLPTTADGWYPGVPPLHDTLAKQAQSTTSLHGCVTLPCSPSDLPVFFIRAGSVIPWAGNGAAAYQTAEDLNFFIYPLAEGQFSYTYLEDDGISWLSEQNGTTVLFDVACDEKRIQVHIQSHVRLTVTLVDPGDREVTIVYK